VTLNKQQYRAASDYGRVAVLLGGTSAEREISLKSGEAVYAALKRKGVDCIKLDPAKDLEILWQAQTFDRAFIVLHGRDGEDGVIQSLLKLKNIPFTGSDVTASAIAMNKLQTKRIWNALGLPSAHFVALNKGEAIDENRVRRIFARLGPKVFVKPNCEGSSVGIAFASTSAELKAALNEAHQYDSIALVESYIAGDEFTVSIVGDKVLPSIRMQTSRPFYDFEAKYTPGATEYFCPSGLNDEEENALAELALRAYQALQLRGWARIDFIREKTSKKFYLLEANTVPGMTETSLVPKAAKQLGMAFDDLVLNILETTMERSA